MWQYMAKRIDFSLACPVILVIWLGQCGCGREHVLQPVDGIVTLDGKPVADAAVLFLPILSDGPPAHATTDSEGRFRLTTSNRSGASAGKYRVAVSKIELRKTEQPPQSIEGNSPRSGFLSEKQLEERYLLPQRYTDASSSVLVADVQAESRNSFTFSLTTDTTVEGTEEPTSENDESTNQ